MQIIELNEKAPRIRNKSISLDFSKNELLELIKIIDKKIETIHKQLEHEEKEIELVYCKDDFDMLSLLNDIHETLNEAVLRKASLETTYEQFDVIWNCLIEEKEYILKNIKKYSRTLMPDLYREYKLIEKIISAKEKEYDSINKKLYPKRKEYINKLTDFYEESSYNGLLIECSELITLHIPMREKDNILSMIDQIMLDIEQGRMRLIIVGDLEMPIEIEAEEIKNVFNKMSSVLSKSISSGSIFSFSIHDYFVFIYSIHNLFPYFSYLHLP